jgi:hypothetical protein
MPRPRAGKSNRNFLVSNFVDGFIVEISRAAMSIKETPHTEQE